MLIGYLVLYFVSKHHYSYISLDKLSRWNNKDIMQNYITANTDMVSCYNDEPAQAITTTAVIHLSFLSLSLLFLSGSVKCLVTVPLYRWLYILLE